MRGLRSTLLLLVVLVGLVGYIYYIGDRESSDDGRERAFAELAAEDIEEIQIRSSDGETSRVQKSDGMWQLVEPVQAAADDGELSSITSSLASLDVQRVVEENATDLMQYGLEPGRIEVAFRTRNDKEPRRILFGERTPTGGDLYARLPGQNRVFLVSSFLDTTFDKNTFALRDKSIITIDREAVDRIEIAAGDRSLTLTKSGSEWRLEKPIAARADVAAVQGALERLATGRMQGIVEPEAKDLKKYRLDPPIATFTAVAGSSRASLLLGETENALIYAKDASRPMVFTVAPTLYTDVIRDLAEYRRKDLFDSRSFTATRVEFRRGTDTVVLEKSKADDGKETWRTGSGATIEETKAQDLLSALTALRAETFDTARNAALQSPVLTVLVTFDENKTEEVSFSRDGATVVASRTDEPGSATVMASSFDEVLKDLEGIK